MRESQKIVVKFDGQSEKNPQRRIKRLMVLAEQHSESPNLHTEQEEKLVAKIVIRRETYICNTTQHPPKNFIKSRQLRGQEAWCCTE